MYGNLLPVLRSLGFVGLVCCAATSGSGVAVAADTAAHVDSTKPNAQPFYPDTARAAGEQGTVLLDVEVRPSGHPTKFRVAQSSGYGDLDTAAVQTVLNWRFVPATRDGDAVTDWTTVRVVYELPQPSAPVPMGQ
jgi:protein TonB